MSIQASARSAQNRANSSHSTGPKTEAGKQRSCLNAMRHGLTGHTIVMPAEDLAAYRRFTQRFFDDLKPVGILEEQLVQSLADTSWRLNRIPALENNLLALGFAENEDHINTEHPEAHAALVIIDALREQTRALAVLSMHGERLSRQFERTMRQLRTLQAERRATKPTDNPPLTHRGFVLSDSPEPRASATVTDRSGSNIAPPTAEIPPTDRIKV